MAHGLEYELLCNSIRSNLFTCKILTDGYTDADIDRNVPVNPFYLRKDKANVIQGTSLSFAMREEVDFEYLKFYTSIPKKYKIEFYLATALLWTGYINTQQYSAEYKPAPNTITFMASDGLGLLKNEPFTLTGRQTELAILMHCINKIGLGLGYSIAINMWASGMDVTRSVLAQCYQECSNFDENNCYEVIEKLLGRYNATITQWEGRWHIVSSKDKKATRMLYTSAGAYDTTAAAPTVLTMGYPSQAGDVYPVDSALWHEIQHGGNKVALVHNYGRRDSFLSNYRFELYASSMFTDWTKGGSVTVEQYMLDGKFFAYLRTSANNDTDYIERSETVVNITGQSFVFECNVCPVGYYGGSFLVPERKPTALIIRMRVTMVVGATTYYLTTEGWSTSAGYITASITSSVALGLIQWTKVQIITNELPGDGTITVRLCRLKYSSTPNYTYYGAAFLEPSIYFLNADDEKYDDEYDIEATFDDSSELVPLSSVEVIASDAPDLPNASLLYDKITRLVAGTPTEEWALADNDTVYTHIQLLLKLLASDNRLPKQTLSGNIRGAALGFDSIIKHVYNSNREFEVVEAEWDVYNEKMRVKLAEILAYSDEDITLDDGTTITGTANLTVASVTPSSVLLSTEETFTVTVHIDNSGTMHGRNTLEWKLVDGDTIVEYDTVTSPTIEGGADDDVVISILGPAVEGTFHVKCKMILDTTWVSSAAIEVGDTDVQILAIDIIDDGYVSTEMLVSFNATNYGVPGSVDVGYVCYDQYNSVVFSGSENIAFAHGNDNYALTGLIYPGTSGTNFYLRITVPGYSYFQSGTFNVLAE